MQELSEDALDLHYGTQCRNYDFTHKPSAYASDQILIDNWLKIFNNVPKEQKLARNSLMLLMYGHLKEFGYLQVPFVDVKNYYKNLNELVDSYTGLTMSSETAIRITKTNNTDLKGNHPTMEQQIRYILRNSNNQIRNPLTVQTKETREHRILSKHRKDGKLFKISKLQPIKEITESSEKESTASHNSIVTVITKTNEEEHLRNITYDSHRCYKKPEKTLNEDENKTHTKSIPVMVCPTCQSKRETDIPNNQAVITNSSMNTNKSRNSQQTMRMLNGEKKNISKKMENLSTDIGSSNSSKYITPTKAAPQVEPKEKKIISSSLPPQFVVHQKMGMDLTERLRQLRIRNDELRQLCLKYYNMDGSLKASHLSKMKAKRTQGFLIGAQRALKRLQRWHGLPHRLKFFATCFRYTGLGMGRRHWRWRAIDRNLEKVTHKWFRNTLQQSQQHAWRSYREQMFNRKLPNTTDTLRLLNQIFNGRRELILERMSHLQELKQLFVQECEEKINPIQLQKMLKNLDIKCRLLAEDLHLVACQQQHLKLTSK